MQRLVGVFLLYLMINMLYFFFVGGLNYSCEDWNVISNVYILVIHLIMIFSSIIITKKEFKNVNQSFLISTLIGLGYLILLYVFLVNQMFILECI